MGGIDVAVDVWTPFVPTGNTRCPTCGATLMLFSGVVPYAYCVGCNQYFISQNKCKHCGKTYDHFVIHGCCLASKEVL